LVEIDESAAMALHKLLGAGFLSGAGISERYSRDWSGDYAGKPAVDEAAASMRICRDAGLSIIPQGGHTGLVGGATPDIDRQVVLSLERMNRIRDIDPVGMTMTVEAGCILQDIKNAAANVGCFFPLSLGAQGSCQIGGNISTNAGGLNVLRYGMMRSSILGLEAVLPDGRVFRDLRRLRKNNTGFDLKQLFVGTEGTLGIVTAATLKLHPSPRRIETVSGLKGVRFERCLHQGRKCRNCVGDSACHPACNRAQQRRPGNWLTGYNLQVAEIDSLAFYRRCPSAMPNCAAF
jgi:FAD/FMN-containing dehydrogenase